MTEWDDIALLKQFAENDSETAFAEIVSGHLNLVYSVALRNVGNAHAAQEISQAVFIILAQKAKNLSHKIILSGWLYQTTRLTAANFLRTEIRRQKREQEAFMQSISDEPANETWLQIAPILDDAISKLAARDRDAIVLRFFENKNLREVGAALGASEDAAKMRVNRALEKLRKIFTKRGATFSAAIIATAVSANSVQAAPVGLAQTISAVAIAKGAAAGGSTLALVKGALKIMAWTKMKLAIAVGVGVLLAAGTTTMVVKELTPFKINEQWFETNGDALAKVPDNLKIIRPTHFGKSGGSSMRGMDERIVCQNFELEWGLVFADNFSGNWPTRVELPEGFPKKHFDYLITLPHDRNDDGQAKVRNVLRDVIKKQFGFVAHRETRDRDVLLLQVKNPNAIVLQKIVQYNPQSSDSAIQSSVEGLNSKSLPMYALADELENHLQIPVIDKTGLTNRIALDLRWNKLLGETVLDTTKRVVLDQLGLELVPTNMPVEMLVVEKAK